MPELVSNSRGGISFDIQFQADWKSYSLAAAFKVHKHTQSCGATVEIPIGFQIKRSGGVPSGMIPSGKFCKVIKRPSGCTRVMSPCLWSLSMPLLPLGKRKTCSLPLRLKLHANRPFQQKIGVMFQSDVYAVSWALWPAKSCLPNCYSPMELWNSSPLGFRKAAGEVVGWYTW